MHVEVAGFLGSVPGNQQHEHGNDEGDRGRNPEDPAPVERGHGPPQDGESGQDHRSELGDGEPAELDHESEDAREFAAFVLAEPGGVDLDHARRAERLQKAVQHPRQHENAQQAPQGGGAEHEIEDDGRERADGERLFPADAVGGQAVEHLPDRIGPEERGEHPAELVLGKTELVADGFVGERKIVAAKVKRGVGEADEAPVEAAPRAESFRVFVPLGDGGICTAIGHNSAFLAVFVSNSKTEIRNSKQIQSSKRMKKREFVVSSLVLFFLHSDLFRISIFVVAIGMVVSLHHLFLLPLDLGRQAVRDAGGRTVSQQPARLFDVGRGVLLVAGPRRLPLDARLLARDRLQ